MDRHRRRPRRRRLLVLCGLVAAGLSAACAPSKPPADSLRTETLLKDTTLYRRMVGEYGATVFTDTALFRRVCAEADSGLNARTAGKCTPRDQSRRPEPPPP